MLPLYCFRHVELFLGVYLDAFQFKISVNFVFIVLECSFCAEKVYKK